MSRDAEILDWLEAKKPRVIRPSPLTGRCWCVTSGETAAEIVTGVHETLRGAVLSAMDDEIALRGGKP